MDILNGTFSASDLIPESSYLVLATIFFMISAVGTLGNGMVILAVILSRKLQTKTNAFVINLAVCDLLMCCCAILNAVGLVHDSDDWPFASINCSELPVITWLFVSASIWTLALIALERFVKITKSSSVYDRVYKRRYVSAMLLLLWLLLIPICLGPLFKNTMGTENYPRFKLCLFVSARGRKITFIIVSAIMRFVNVVPPLIVILVAYVKIILHVKRHVRRVAADPNIGPGLKRVELPIPQGQATAGNDRIGNSNDVDSAERLPPRPVVPQPANRINHWVKREIKIAKNLASVTIVFFVCYIPVLTLNEHMSFLHMGIVLSLTCCNSSLNPFLYAAKYPVFGTVFRCILTCNLRSIPYPSRQLRTILSLA